jgi:N utilization substance protein B
MDESRENLEPKALSRRKARRKAFELLFELEQHAGITVDELLRRTFEEDLFDESDGEEGVVVGEFNESNREFISEVCRLAHERQDVLDDILQHYPHGWRFDRIGVPERTILRMALAELMFMDTPFKIVINEALDLSKLYGEADSNRFVNGILGGIVRDIDSLKRKHAV